MDRHNSSAKKRDVVSISIEAEKQIYLNDPSFEQKSRGFAESAGQQRNVFDVVGDTILCLGDFGLKVPGSAASLFLWRVLRPRRYPKKGCKEKRTRKKVVTHSEIGV